MDRAGIARRHFAEILRAMQDQAGPSSEAELQYLASHPPTSERISRFEK